MRRPAASQDNAGAGESYMSSKKRHLWEIWRGLHIVVVLEGKDHCGVECLAAVSRSEKNMVAAE